MTKSIEKITLFNFRGASGKCEINFDTKKSLVMIFGENGTGKSTICDAIDFVANSNFGSIEDRSVGSNGHLYVPTISKATSELKIEVSSKEATWKGVLSGRSAQVSGGPHSLCARVLRRARLLKLVEAQPAKRHEALQEFIDVAKIEASEQTLRQTIAATQADLEQAGKILNETSTALDMLWKEEGSQGNSAEEWAKQKSEVDKSNLKEYIDGLELLIQLLSVMATKWSELKEANNTVIGTTKEVEAVEKEIAILPQLSGTQAIELVDLLQKAQNVVSEPNEPNTCPVCEQPISVADLRKSISTRLADMQSHQSLAKRRNQAINNLSVANATCKRAEVAYVAAARSAALKVKDSKHLPLPITPIDWHNFETFLQSTSVDHDQLSTAKAIQMQLNAIEPACRQDLQTSKADWNQHNAIKGYYDRIIKNRINSNKLSVLLGKLERALNICESTRKTYAESVLRDVYDEMNRLYSIIHPNEPLGSLRLWMDSKKRGSIEQDATFAGHQGIPPQAYFSESHLDTLGFCVWLALAKRSNPKDTVIVLDDVFTSVDGVHLTRIIELLTDIVKDFAQVIVTTHYRTWRDRYRLPLGPGLSAQLLELHRWSLESGVCLSGTKLATQDLVAALNTQPLDRQAVASRAGILLEAILDRFTLQYRRRVPRTRDGDLTLGDLLDSCKKLFDVLVVEKMLPEESSNPPSDQPTVKAAIQPFFQDTGPWVFIRNQVGCHFNFAGSEVVDSDVESFGKATASLVKALTCLNCGDIPSRPDGTHFRCGCKQTKMMPLECK